MTPLHSTPCNCLALRQAARQVTQLYDRLLAPSGLRATQYSILSNLHRLGPDTLAQLAGRLVLDRTTLTRNLRPLQREGLVESRAGRDRRRREVDLTPLGQERLRSARPLWEEAQRRFENSLGATQAADLRQTLALVVTRAGESVARIDAASPLD